MGKIVLITGANKGLGYHLARFLLGNAPEFDKIIITSRNIDLGLAAKQSLGHSERLDFHQLDVTSQESIQTLKNYVASTYGHLDVLVNNAAVLIYGDQNAHLNVSKVLATNFYGLKNTTEAFLPLLEPSGHIVQVSAALGKTNLLKNPSLQQRLLNPNLTTFELLEIAEEIGSVKEDWAARGWKFNDFGIYAHSKALVNVYTKILARDLVNKGSFVRVNAVHPGWVRTDMGGPNAPLSADEGIAMPAFLVRDTSNVNGKYWENNRHEDVR